MGRKMRRPLEAAELRPALRDFTADIAFCLLGEPNRSYSSSHEFRFGNNGSLAIVVSGPKAGLWHDHKSGFGGDIFALIQRENRCSFLDALEYGASFIRKNNSQYTQTEIAQNSEDKEVLEQRKLLAKQIWAAGKSFNNSLAEVYLRNRMGQYQDVLPPRLGEVLRFHPSLRFGTEVHPALIGAITNIHTDALQGVQLTALNAMGSRIQRNGKTLRRIRGIKKGGAIKLTPDDEVCRAILVGEGIETVLSAMALTGFQGWALIDAGSLKGFPVLSGIETLSIAVDADEAGRNAANMLAKAWSESNREVFMIEPELRGFDLNDLIRSDEDGH